MFGKGGGKLAKDNRAGSYNTGVYFIKVSTGNGIHTQKFITQ
ncbi:MAG: T9SS type A sorting domain-containing protein [Bacteroidia bacterium]|nr:T9SS type A sorting domain-containing protein [Bacteroidia bacterium]